MALGLLKYTQDLKYSQQIFTAYKGTALLVILMAVATFEATEAAASVVSRLLPQ